EPRRVSGPGPAPHPRRLRACGHPERELTMAGETRANAHTRSKCSEVRNPPQCEGGARLGAAPRTLETDREEWVARIRVDGEAGHRRGDQDDAEGHGERRSETRRRPRWHDRRRRDACDEPREADD